MLPTVGARDYSLITACKPALSMAKKKKEGNKKESFAEKRLRLVNVTGCIFGGRVRGKGILMGRPEIE